MIQKGLDRQLVYYWFEGRGRQLTGDFAAKFYTMADSVTRGRTDGGLVRLITPIGPDEAVAEADARLQRFLAAAVAPLPRFIPDDYEPMTLDSLLPPPATGSPAPRRSSRSW